MTLENAAFTAGVAEGPARYRVSWYAFDNNTGETRPLAETGSFTSTIAAPGDLPTTVGQYVMADISVDTEFHREWRRPVRAYFRRETDRWAFVGFERLPTAIVEEHSQ